MGSSLSPYVMGNCHDQRKIIFRIFQKNFDFLNFALAGFERPPVSPIFPRPSKFFFADFGRKFHDFTIFDACFSDLRWSADIVRSIPGTVLARSDRLR